MTIDFNAFTPGMSLVGGLLIGLAAAILILFNGRVLGVSGMLGNLLQKQTWQAGWALPALFFVGLMSAPLLYSLFKELPALEVTNNPWLLISAGLLVGFGTRLGSGCTSGHGVCGLSRLSLRSLSATLMFMAAGVITVTVLRHAF